jgi:hypothetical protein
MRCDVLRLVAQEHFPILEADARHPQSMPVGVLKIVYPNPLKSTRTRPPDLHPVTPCCAPARRLPLDSGHGFPLAREHKIVHYISADVALKTIDSTSNS